MQRPTLLCGEPGTIVPVDVRGVLAFKSVGGGRTIALLGGDEEVVLHDTISELEYEFSQTFLRINRSALVRTRAIQALVKLQRQQWYVDLDHATADSSRWLGPISRSKVAAVKAALVAPCDICPHCNGTGVAA